MTRHDYTAEFEASRAAMVGPLTIKGAARDKLRAAMKVVLDFEVGTGSTFIVAADEGSLFVNNGITRRMIELPLMGGEAWRAYMFERYRLSGKEAIAVPLYEAMRNHIASEGDVVGLRRFARFDKANNVAYLSGYDGTAWRLDGNEPRRISNGDEGVMFADDDGGIECEPIIGPHGVLLDTLLGLNFAEQTPGGITPEQQRRAMTVWMFALAFPDLMPTKPLMLIEGAPGSGKSSCVQLLQLALMGAKKPMILRKNQEDDFGVILVRSPIAVFDNLDSYMEWIPDAVCAYATSGTWVKRKLYTDGEEVTIRPHAFIAVASKNPASFRREDTADRCIVIRLDRLEAFTRQGKLEDAIAAERPKLLGEYLYYCNQIVGELKLHGFDLDGVDDGTSRMADFSALAHIVARVLQWPDGAVNEMLAGLQSERDAFVNEEDSLSELLFKWLDMKPNGRTNVFREMSGPQLYAELTVIADMATIPFYKSHRTLAQKIRSPHLDKDFNIITTAVGGHRMYRIGRKTDANLYSVPTNDAASAPR